LAGLAAAVGLCRRGCRVELFEARRRLGGRAGSIRDARSGHVIDRCQHVAMGCCTNLADFCRRLGITDCFRRFGRLHFIGPEGSAYPLEAVPWLPPPLHLVPGLLRLGYLSFGDRLRIVRVLGRLARPARCGRDATASIGSWLRRHGASEASIERFWSVVIVSALGETPDRVSVATARKVLVDGFLASRRAYELEIPRFPLEELFDRRAGDWLQARGVTIHRGTPVRQIEGDGRRAEAVVLPDGSRRRFDAFVAAVPWRTVRALFSEVMLAALEGLRHVGRIEPGSITAAHLWFDRPITSLPHAALVGRLGQWVFNHGPRRLGTGRSGVGYYYQVVISAAHAVDVPSGHDLVARLEGDLRAIWPKAREARLLHGRVVTDPAAVFSAVPGVEGLRPPQRTSVDNLALAGDWTSTGWPATMESAVRSGYLAAETVSSSVCGVPAGGEKRLLAPDLPPAWLCRMCGFA
jgi:squalene-associated FAD-dependent desaturase